MIHETSERERKKVTGRGGGKRGTYGDPWLYLLLFLTNRLGDEEDDVHVYWAPKKREVRGRHEARRTGSVSPVGASPLSFPLFHPPTRKLMHDEEFSLSEQAPLLVVSLTGLPGSGKSSLSAALAAHPPPHLLHPGDGTWVGRTCVVEFFDRRGFLPPTTPHPTHVRRPLPPLFPLFPPPSTCSHPPRV